MLIPCPACTRQVSVEAAHCPGCGHPIAGEASDAAIPPETGQPSRNRARAGVTVAVLGILVSGVASALFPPREARSARSGEAELADTSYLQGLSTHEPQTVRVPGEFGGLTLTVPAELPELQPEVREPRAEMGEIEACTSYLGKLDNVSLGLDAFRAAPGYEYDFNAVADQMMRSATAELTFRELSRAREQVAGKLALRLIFELKGIDVSLAFTRY